MNATVHNKQHPARALKKIDTLPIIDLSLAHDPHKQETFYAQLRDIARNIGFFYLVGHGVDVAEIRKIESESRRFFALPQAEKNKIAMEYSPHFRGYTAAKEEFTRKKRDNREQIDVGEESHALTLNGQDPEWKRLQGPNLWPTQLPGFKESVLHWQAQVRGVAERLLKAFLVALKLPENALDDILSGEHVHLLKLIHYPGSDRTEDAQGCGPHKDSCILTVLLQDEVGGLQVETDHGWIDIPPLKDAFVINIGEILELATNGYLRANVHQVLTPKKGVERYSIAYFLQPRLDAYISVLDLDKDLAAQALGPESDPENPLFRQVGENVLKGRLRSHLLVTKRFYPQQYARLIAANDGKETLAAVY